MIGASSDAIVGATDFVTARSALTTVVRLLEELFVVLVSFTFVSEATLVTDGAAACPTFTSILTIPRLLPAGNPLIF
jgi:hypothetical protein